MTGPNVTGRNGTGRNVLAVRLDSDGDVLLSGPAVAALRRSPDGEVARRVDLLCSPAGAAAGALLPGVDDVLVTSAPWSGYRPPSADRASITALVDDLAARSYDECVIFTSYHQSPLPMALVARMAGIAQVAGTSDDYPGSLLDVRFRRASAPDGSGGGHEVLAALALVAATGRDVPDDPHLAVRRPLSELPSAVAALADSCGPFVVLHPGASVPARAPSPAVAGAIAAALVDAGWPVVITGGPGERALTAQVAAAAPGALDLGGGTDLAGLAAVLAAASAVVVGNTGPAHLAAAVDTPVVSLFSAVMPAERWAPWGVPTVLLGAMDAPCAMTRARECPVAGHPCLDVAPAAVLVAVSDLAAGRGAPLPAVPARAVTGPGL